MRENLLRDTLAVVRLTLLATTVLALGGTGVELLLLEHTDGVWQWIPLVLLAAALLVLLWFGVERGRRSLGVFRALMILFLVCGLAGVLLHYRGNVEFELEMSPALQGWELFRKSMMGATPALAPGAMIQIGLVGLAWTFRHPALGGGRHDNSTTTG